MRQGVWTLVGVGQHLVGRGGVFWGVRRYMERETGFEAGRERGGGAGR